MSNEAPNLELTIGARSVKIRPWDQRSILNIDQDLTLIWKVNGESLVSKARPFDVENGEVSIDHQFTIQENIQADANTGKFEAPQNPTIFEL